MVALMKELSSTLLLTTLTNKVIIWYLSIGAAITSHLYISSHCFNTIFTLSGST